MTTRDSRYVAYFSDSDNGEWYLSCDSRNSPLFLTPDDYSFNLDTLSSFQHDIVLTWADTVIYARITENAGLPVNNYKIEAYSGTLGAYTEAVSGTGSNNITKLHVSSLDPDNWEVYINRWDDNFMIPPGFIVQGEAYNVSPGDTVNLNMVSGTLINGTVFMDIGDAPIDWDMVSVWAGDFWTVPEWDGAYYLYADIGAYYLNVYADGYITDPASRYLELTADTSGGLDFTINEAHCNVSGTLVNLPLPLDFAYYEVVARTGTDHTDGYYVNAWVDSTTGTYQMNLCDGEWTIIPPEGFTDAVSPGPVIVTIGESPDDARTIDFEYILAGIMCGDADGNEVLNIMDAVFLVNYLYKGGPPPASENSADVNSSSSINIMDAVHIVNYLYKGGPGPNCP